MIRYSFRLLGFSLCLTFFGLLCCENRANRSLRHENSDLRLQLAQSLQRCDTFYVRDSVFVWKERIVEVDKTDYKKQLADRELIKSLRLRINQVESENRLLLATRDTVVLEPVANPGGVDSLLLHYSDEWADFSYDADARRLLYSVRDSLTTFITREYKHRFLWWKWGTKGYNVYHVSHNPHCKVVYNKYISVK